MPTTPAAAALTGSFKTILSAALLAHPAPAVAEWPQASDGPVFETTKTSVNRQPDKAVFLRPKVSPKGGVVLPARMDTRLVTRFQHPAHPMRMKPQRVAFCLNQEPETMTTTTGHRAHNPNRPDNLPAAIKRIDFLTARLSSAGTASESGFSGILTAASIAANAAGLHELLRALSAITGDLVQRAEDAHVGATPQAAARLAGLLNQAHHASVTTSVLLNESHALLSQSRELAARWAE